MEDLEDKSYRALAQWQAGWKPSTDKYILAELEWERRAREKQHLLDQELLNNQHELNLIILEKQSKLTKFSIAVGFIGVVIGAVLGAFMQYYLTNVQPSINVPPNNNTSNQVKDKTNNKSPNNTFSSDAKSAPANKALGNK